MNNQFRKLVENLVPFLLLGIAIALIGGLLIMFSYLLLWGIVIGFVLWIVFFVKNLLFPPTEKGKSTGIIIEHKNDD